MKSIDEEVRKINKTKNLSYRELGEMFNTSGSQIHRIIKNKIWKSPEGGL